MNDEKNKKENKESLKGRWDSGALMMKHFFVTFLINVAWHPIFIQAGHVVHEVGNVQFESI